MCLTPCNKTSGEAGISGPVVDDVPVGAELKIHGIEGEESKSLFVTGIIDQIPDK